MLLHLCLLWNCCPLPIDLFVNINVQYWEEQIGKEGPGSEVRCPVGLEMEVGLFLFAVRGNDAGTGARTNGGSAWWTSNDDSGVARSNGVDAFGV